jgi:hypothetical protein
MTGGGFGSSPIIVKEGASNIPPPIEQTGGSIFDMGKLLIKKIGF